MRQVVQRRKRRSVGQSRRRLDDAGLAVRAAVRDLEDAAGLAAELPRDGVEIRTGQPPGGGGLGGAGGRGGPGGGAIGSNVGETPCGASAMVCHSDVYHGSPLALSSAALPARSARAALGRQLHLIRNVAGLDEAEPLAGLRRNVNGVGEFRPSAPRGRRSPRATVPRSPPAASSPCAARSTCAPGPAMVSVSTQTTAARMAARRAAEPSRCSDCCSADVGDRFADRVSLSIVFGLAAWPGLASCAARVARAPSADDPRSRPAYPTCRTWPVGMPGTAASGRAASLRARAIWPPDREPGEGKVAGVARGVAERLLDTQQLVVLGDALATGGRTGLDLAAADRDREVGDRGVLGLAAAVAHHRAVAAVVRQRHRVERLGQRADLVHLHQQVRWPRPARCPPRVARGW